MSQPLPRPPAAVVDHPPSALPAEDVNFELLITALQTVDEAGVEVRIHEQLSRQNLAQPIQFGLFATVAFRAGDEVAPYGGILRHQLDVQDPAAKSHARRLGEGFVLDGLPLANMLDRPTPHTAAGLDALLQAGMQARLPTSTRYAASDLERFKHSGFGFMSNQQRMHAQALALSPANVSIGSRAVKVASVTYSLPILIATRNIAVGEEIISPYGRQSPEPPPAAASAAASTPAAAAVSAAASTPTAAVAASQHMKTHLWALFDPSSESRAAADAWLAWGKQQGGWKTQRGEWDQLDCSAAPENLHESGRSAGRSFLRSALLAEAYGLTLISQKLLRSEPGHGLQEEHCDAATLDAAEGCHSVLLYLTAGDSTAVPVKSYDKAAHRICWELDAEAATNLKSRLLLDTHPVQPGAGMVLSHKVMHHGPRNNTQQTRFVLFQHWVPHARAINRAAPDSDSQRLPYGLP
jgi:hypothetical protein